MVGVCGVVVRVFGVPSRSLLGRSVLGARLIWAVVAPRYAGAAAAAAPVAMLATGVAVPAEAELPSGAAMGLGSHGECTVGSPSPASAFFFDVFALLGFCARLPGSESVASGAHGLLITGFSVLFVLVCFALALAMGFQCHLLPVVSAFTAASLRSLSFSF